MRSGLRQRAAASAKSTAFSDAAAPGPTPASVVSTADLTSRRPQQSHPTFRSDPYERPRQIAITTSLVAALFLLSSMRQSDDNNDNIRAATLAVFLSFLTLSYLQTRDLVLSFPARGFWRVVYGASSFYALFLVALAQMDKPMARAAVATLFPDIGELQDFEVGLYANKEAVMGTCRLSKQALLRQFFHCPWVLAHAVGWTMKMLVLRDYHMAFLAAVIFEITEVTLMHVVPEFEECWWDSVFLDTLGANILGMALGYRINKWMGREKRDAMRGLDLGADLDWVGRYAPLHENETQRNTANNWLVFTSMPRLFEVLALAVFLSLSDLNTFLLINSLGIANNTSWFVLLRLAVISLIWFPAAAEFYSFINDSKKSHVRLGPSIWALACTTTAELAVSMKFFPLHMSRELERHYFGIPLVQVLVPYLLSSVIFTIWAILKYEVFSGLEKGQKTNKLDCNKKRERELIVEQVDILLGAAAIPMLYMLTNGWKYD